MRGPLPNATENTRRRNAPTINPTNLPAKGRSGAVPKPPAGYEFRECGRAWWAWAWKTPQAAAWNDGYLYAVARRAMLEDDLDCIRRIDSGSFDDLLGETEDDTRDQVQWVVSALRAIAGNELGLMKEARELDDRLGLTAKAFGQLRWQIKDEPVQGAAAITTAKGGRRSSAVLSVVEGAS